MTYPNIALTGAMRAGKDEVARYLTEKYGYTRFAFGDELKRYANDIFDAGATQNKPRELYQWFGQTMRQRDPDVWVRKCFVRIHEEEREADLSDTFMGVEEPSFRAVLTDVRQPNEMAECRRQGYVIIRVKATSALRIQRAVEAEDTFDLRDLTHETESHTDGFAVDYEVVNDGSLAELHAQIDAVMTDITRNRFGRIGNGPNV